MKWAERLVVRFIGILILLSGFYMFTLGDITFSLLLGSLAFVLIMLS